MQFKKLLNVFIWILLFAGIVAATSAVLLPRILEFQLKRILPQYLAPYTLDFSVDSIGLFQASASNIRFNEHILINQVVTKYNLKTLRQASIEKLTLSGIQLEAFLTDSGQIGLQGFEFPENKSEQSTSMSSDVFSYLPSKIRVKNSRLNFSVQSKQFYLPFDMLIDINKKSRQIDFAASIYPFGEKINLIGTWNFQKGLTHVLLESQEFELDHLNLFANHAGEKFKDISLSGKCDLKLESFSPYKNWSVYLSQVVFRPPINTSMKDFKGVIQIKETSLSMDTSVLINHPMADEVPVTAAVELSRSLNNKSDYRVNIETKPLKQWQLNHHIVSGRFKDPQIKCNIASNKTGAAGTLKVTTGRGVIESGDQTATMAGLSIISPFSVDIDPKALILSAQPKIKVQKIKGSALGNTVRLPLAKAEGTFSYSSKNGTTGRIRLTTSGGSAVLEQKGIHMAGISCDLPLAFPLLKSQPKGAYEIKTIDATDRFNFSLKGNVKQKGAYDFIIDGIVVSGLLEKAQPRFSCNIRIENDFKARLDYEIDPVQLNEDDIRRFLPDFQDNVQLSMTVSGKGFAGFENNNLSTGMILDLSNGTIDLPELALHVSGIRSQMHFNDLMKPETIPGQILFIDSIEKDKFKIEEIKMRLSVEDAKYLLVENVKFNWCQGSVSSEAIRFPDKENRYSIVLFCDELDLAELLSQMGVFHAEGSGTLNGKINVIYDQGDIIFEDGFLFSTPRSGEKVQIDKAGMRQININNQDLVFDHGNIYSSPKLGGKIKIKDTDKLVAGIPMDNPQFINLYVAREALKDYDYKWAKITFNTFEDILTVNLQLDGKPAGTLPFRFNKEIGGLARVAGNTAGSEFKGVKLDVNLSLPFKEVMKFGNKLESMFGQ